MEILIQSYWILQLVSQPTSIFCGYFSHLSLIFFSENLDDQGRCIRCLHIPSFHVSRFKLHLVEQTEGNQVCRFFPPVFSFFTLLEGHRLNSFHCSIFFSLPAWEVLSLFGNWASMVSLYPFVHCLCVICMISRTSDRIPCPPSFIFLLSCTPASPGGSTELIPQKTFLLFLLI